LVIYQESYLYGMFSMHLCKQPSGLKDVLDPYHIRLHLQYNLTDDEHKMFETRRRQEERELKH